MPHGKEKDLLIKACREAEERFNEVIEEEMDSAYAEATIRGKLLDGDFENSLWECEIKEIR